MKWEKEKSINSLNTLTLKPAINHSARHTANSSSRYCESYFCTLRILSVSSTLVGVYYLLQDILNYKPKGIKDKQVERVCESK